MQVVDDGITRVGILGVCCRQVNAVADRYAHGLTDEPFVRYALDQTIWEGRQLINAKNSLTADYLTGKEKIPVPSTRRKTKNKLTITRAHDSA